MSDETTNQPSDDQSQADDATKATPITANARRVLGVLVEKAKTTPDNYPLSAAALVSGCNQKSNRAPQMQLDETDVLNAIDELRGVGAAIEIQGGGRVNKYRHSAYDWWGVDSAGAAVMTELTLRGPQTAGEIRTRASRMYALPNLEAVQNVLTDLTRKGLVEALSPPGRGQTFAHKLYTPPERQYLEARLEKQNAKTAEAAPATPPPASVVDQLLARFDVVNEKLAALEKRIDELES